VSSPAPCSNTWVKTHGHTPHRLKNMQDNEMWGIAAFSGFPSLPRRKWLTPGPAAAHPALLARAHGRAEGSERASAARTAPPASPPGGKMPAKGAGCAPSALRPAPSPAVPCASPPSTPLALPSIGHAASPVLHPRLPKKSIDPTRSLLPGPVGEAKSSHQRRWMRGWQAWNGKAVA
jgi:hypothetical protein